MDEISDIALKKYRQLVDDEAFIDYFQTATPIQLVEKLNIGSRPSRRKATSSISDLRAIPWVFSWTQCRANIASWFGIGTAISQWVGNESSRLDEIIQMYGAWPFFKTLFQNVHLGLGRADMNIAGHYSQLADEKARHVFDMIRNEFELTCQEVLKVTGHEEILDTEQWLRHSIRVRNPYVDPLNHMQVALLQRYREQNDLDPDQQDELVRVLANSVNGIAAGLQNVG